MTAIAQPLSDRVAGVPRVHMIVAAIAVCSALAGAFFVGRETAPEAHVSTPTVRPVHLTASLHSADGERRLQVMRKMNGLNRP